MPLVPVDKTLEQMSWDEVINNTWCKLEGLQVLCLKCHEVKTNEEKKLRKANKNGSRT